MSHHDSIRGRLPKVTSLAPPKIQERSLVPKRPALTIVGQGCITFTLKPNAGSPTCYILTFEQGKTTSKTGKPLPQADYQLVFELTNTATFYIKTKEGLTPLVPQEYLTPSDDFSIGIDSNPHCVYWVSIDSFNKRLRYGKGERRASTVLLESVYDEAKTLFTKDKEEKFPFINRLKYINADDNCALSHAWTDPVTVEPPAIVVPSSQFTMNDAAATAATTPSSLSTECQVLYGNVTGENFSINTPDFPDFEQAIEYSLRTPGKLAYRIIDFKLRNNEFSDGGEKKADAPAQVKHVEDDYKEVYLRITLGVSEGESPGVPYVMEIWPPGCGSPIHHHGYTHAIIKVLRGAIDVDIYRMLPMEDNPTKPLKSVRFKKDDVTYLMPQVNQFHRLRNHIDQKETCITIQCYSYAHDDDIHYPTFNYIENGELGHFEPLSDYDFLKFKAEIKKEWEDYLKDNEFWRKELQPLPKP
ncbi:MAG: cysteine dioxygenase [Chitinophagales bacterium]